MERMREALKTVGISLQLELTASGGPSRSG